jgi:predicted RNase H-like HicB family nuclease
VGHYTALVTMQYTFTAVFVRGESGRVVAYLEELPGAHAQGATIQEAEKNLHQAAELILSANRRLTHESFAAAHVLRRGPFRVGKVEGV